MVTDRELTWEELVVAAQGRQRDARFEELSDTEVTDRLAVGASELAAATCRWLEVLAEFVIRGVWAHEGARTPGAWLSWKLGIAPSTAREHVRVALRLEEFPRVKARFAAGTLSYSKVRCLTRFGDPSFEVMLLEWADDATAAQLEAVARGFRTAERGRLADAYDPDGLGWSVEGRSWADGSRSLTIRGPVEVIAALEDDIARLAQRQVDDRDGSPRDDGSADELPDDDRSATELSRDDGSAHDAPPGGAARGDAARSGSPPDRAGADPSGLADDLPERDRVSRLPKAIDRVEALAHAAAAAAAATTPPDTSGLDRHTLVVTVRAEDLLASSPQQHGEAIMVHDDHRRIRTMDPRTLRRLACDAGVVVVATDTDGSPLDVGRRRRRTTAALRRALMQRDRGCTFPGCMATRHLHAHHVEHWADDGATDLQNLVLLCGFHHRFIHQADWTIEVEARGRHRFRPADQHETVPRVGNLPGATPDTVAASAPRGASAEALMPRTYDGAPLDLDAVVSVLQVRHAARREELRLAA